MTQTNYGPHGVDVEFPGWETMMAGRSFLHIPTHAIVSAHTEAGWTSEVLGMRSGLVISGYRKLGTFTHPSGVRRLVSMTRGSPLLRLRTLRGEIGFDEVLLSTAHAALIAHRFNESRAR